MSDSHKKAISDGLKKKYKNNDIWNKGLTKESNEHIKKMSNSLKGRNSWNKNKNLSEQHKINISLSKTGSSEFVGYRTNLNKKIRNSNNYVSWRDSIFKRDNYVCKICGKTKCFVEAHHINPLGKIIEHKKITNFLSAMNCKELWDINNGITLCTFCHGSVDKQRSVFLNE